MTSLSSFKSSAVSHDIQAGKLSHSVLLLSPDTFALDEFAKNMIMALMCEQDDKPCGVCEACRKVQHNNNVDVLYYPKENKVLNSAEIENLIDEVYSAPYESDRKVFVIKNANQIDQTQQNKLLKTLEEPPSKTYFILIATEDSNILQTIKSRCRIVRVPQLTESEILSVLKDNNVPDNIATLAFSYCDGSCSQALKYATNEHFAEIVALTENILSNFRKSWQMLDFASKLYSYNENFEEVLDVFLNICARAVAILCGSGKVDKIATEVAQSFSVDALVALNRGCLNLIEQRKRNCNFNSIVDEFLFMILEVRHKYPV